MFFPTIQMRDEKARDQGKLLGRSGKQSEEEEEGEREDEKKK